MTVATGLSIGNVAAPELAAQAVEQAMARARLSVAGSVLLLLTAEFARDPTPALRAAAKTANCTQVMGCSATGVFTESDWVLDAPAAAALVFPDTMALKPPAPTDPRQLLLTLAAPNAINTTWMTAPGVRFGGVSGDATGQGPFSVWQHAKGSPYGHCEAALCGVKGAIAAAHGLRVLSVPRPVTAVHGHDLIELAGQPALATLQAARTHYQDRPMHYMMAVFADSIEAIRTGDYQIAALVSGNDDEDSVTLARQLRPGQYLSWAVRDAETALGDLRRTVDALEARLAVAPEFALLFSCLGRGPYFYGGVDRDLALLTRRFPDMPILGFYGNGEIAPRSDADAPGGALLEYSAVLGLFARS